MLNHHPSIEMLTDYAAGSLTLPHAMCIATHVELCPECQQQVNKLELLGGQLLTDEKQEQRSLEGLKNALFTRLQEAPEQTQTTAEKGIQTAPQPAQHTNGLGYKVPRSLKQFVTQAYDDLTWMRLSPSFKIATLLNEKGGPQISLTRVKAGAHMPTHTHTGDEITLVLEGAFSDESGMYRKGDFVCRDASHKHKPIVTKDAECICLTVLDAPIEFTGWFTRLLNPLIRRHHPLSS